MEPKANFERHFVFASLHKISCYLQFYNVRLYAYFEAYTIQKIELQSTVILNTIPCDYALRLLIVRILQNKNGACSA